MISLEADYVERGDTYEQLILLDPLDQIVLTALHLHCMHGLKRQDTNAFMRLLTRNSLVNKFHYHVFRCYERDLLFDLRPNHSRKNNKTVSNVVEEDEKGISQEEHLWGVDSTNGAIVKSTLKPLVGKRI